MNKTPTADEVLRAALDALNRGDPAKASRLALQVLAGAPQNHDAMTVPGAARFAILGHPHDVFFLKLRQLGFQPKLAVDVGSYQGDWTRALKRTFPDARALMVEAQPGKAEALAAVVAELTGVSHCIALAGERDRDDVVFHVMDTPYGSTGSSLYPEQTSFPRDTVPLPMRTLDRILAEAGMAGPDLLKIDVQGAELDVLAGAKEALTTVQFIHMELSTLQYNAGAPLIADVLPVLDAAGFVLFDVLEEHRIAGDLLSQIDALFIRRDSGLRPAGILF